MSLNAAAQHLAAHGRGPDTTLVHMSKGELESLQGLAKAHGGSLSINPHTGLPEAGFLESILPMVAGAALNTFVPGLGAMGSALLTGAVTGMASGSLSKGMMAGLGAYGGAGLMGGLMGAGEGALAQTALNQSAAESARLGMSQAPFAAEAQSVASQAPFMDKMSAGFSKIGEAPGQFLKDNWKYAAAAAAPSVMEAMKEKPQQAPATDKSMGQRYVYEPNKLQGPYTASPTGVEQQYFNPQYRKVSDTEAKSIYGYADGGTVSQDGGYTYDPLTQIFKKIESMPSDNQKVNQPTSATQMGGGINPNQAAINAHFDAMTPAQKASHNEGLANALNALAPGAALRAMLAAPEGKISPLAVPSLMVSKAKDASQMALGFVLNKFAQPNPNPEAVQVVDNSTLSPAAKAEAEGEAEGKVTVGEMSPADAVSMAIAQSLGEGSNGMGLGFGAPGATSGNAGAMGFGPSGMAAGVSSGGTSSGLSGLHGTGGGGVGGPGVGTGSGSGGGAAAMGTGAHGMAAGAGGPGGARKGGLSPEFSHHMAKGGLSDLGDYSDGGRLLRGPGDGVSDSIPAQIGRKQPARLADGEFVVPARIVSELGNGSTEAGARKLYAMMDRVQKARGQTVGKGRVAKNSRADRYLPA